MKVYICWTIPDYNGIYIEAIFSKEEDAIEFVKKWNATHDDWDHCDYDVYEVK